MASGVLFFSQKGSECWWRGGDGILPGKLVMKYIVPVSIAFSVGLLNGLVERK